MCFFDYPNHLCVQNGILRRLDAIEILQIRLDKYYQFITFHYCDLLSTGGSIHTAMGNTALILGAYCSCVIIIVGFAMTVGYFFSPAQTSARPYLRVIGPGGVSVGVSGLVITCIAACGKARNGGSGQRTGTRRQRGGNRGRIFSEYLKPN